MSPLINSLCSAQADAASGDQQAANREYFDHAQQPLHELATALQRRDRALAARFLEAHQRVEDDLVRHPSAESLAYDIDQLRRRVGDALTATGTHATAGCSR